MRGGRPGLPIAPLPPIGRPDVKTQPRCNLWFYDYMFAAQNWTITRRALLTIVTTVFIADFAAYNRSDGRAEAARTRPEPGPPSPRGGWGCTRARHWDHRVGSLASSAELQLSNQMPLLPLRIYVPIKQDFSRVNVDISGAVVQVLAVSLDKTVVII